MAMDQYNDDNDEIMIQYMIYILNIEYPRILLLSALYPNQGCIDILDTFISSYLCHSYFINIDVNLQLWFI